MALRILFKKKKENGRGVGKKVTAVFAKFCFQTFAVLPIDRHICASFLPCQIMSCSALGLGQTLTQKEEALGPF